MTNIYKDLFTLWMETLLHRYISIFKEIWSTLFFIAINFLLIDMLYKISDCAGNHFNGWIYENNKKNSYNYIFYLILFYDSYYFYNIY